MKTIHIDQATNAQLDYAVAVAQRWEVRVTALFGTQSKIDGKPWWDNYRPTTNQAQCGELISKFKVNLRWQPEKCEAWIGIDHKENRTRVFDETMTVAVVKSVLWSRYHDGMIPVAGE